MYWSFFYSIDSEAPKVCGAFTDAAGGVGVQRPLAGAAGVWSTPSEKGRGGMRRKKDSILRRIESGWSIKVIVESGK